MVGKPPSPDLHRLVVPERPQAEPPGVCDQPEECTEPLKRGPGQAPGETPGAGSSVKVDEAQNPGPPWGGAGGAGTAQEGEFLQQPRGMVAQLGCYKWVTENGVKFIKH